MEGDPGRHRPLMGKCIVVTRARGQAEESLSMLRDMGASALLIPTIRICEPRDLGPLDHALANLPGYDWIVFASVNAVDAVWRRLEENAGGLGDAQGLLAGVRVAAVGPATAQGLAKRGVVASLVPVLPRAEALAQALIQAGVRGARVLVPQAAGGRAELTEALGRAGAYVTRVDAYQTKPAELSPADLEAFHSGRIDGVTLASPSAARSLGQNLAASGLPAPWPFPVFCIGDVTADAAREECFRVEGVSDEARIESLIQLVASYFTPR